MIYSLGSRMPALPAAGTYWVARSAVVIGDVSLGMDVSIWFGAVIRGDNEPIHIGEGTNIQDNTVIHTDPQKPTIIGKNCTIGHKALIHGCIIGDTTIVGMGATILNGTRIGSNCFVAANSLVTQHKEFPDRSFIMGSPARRVRDVTDEELAHMNHLAQKYQNNWKLFQQGLKEIKAL